MGYDNEYQDWGLADLMDKSDGLRDEFEQHLKTATWIDKFYELLEIERELTRREE